LAKILLSVRLDIAAADPGTTELLVWAVPFSAGAAGRRLAANHISVRWGAYLRVLLGNVELLFAAKVGLSHARRSIPAYFRNAVAGIWRLYTFRAGIVCAEELSLAARGAAADLAHGAPVRLASRARATIIPP